jgi:hypothetical protein
MNIAFHQVFGAMHQSPYVIHMKGEQFRVQHIDGESISENFTHTDIDGNASDPYPLTVSVGPQISIVTGLLAPKRKAKRNTEQ